MARLPNAHHVIIDERKLRDYALNPDHPRGGHKARVFAAALGYTRSDYAGLVEQLHRGVLACTAVSRPRRPDGARFQVDIPVAGPKGTAVVRTGWIVREGEHAPRLTSLYVLL